MGALKVVLYAEGAGERLGELNELRAPGDLLHEEALGSAHILLRRAIASSRTLPVSGVLFHEPLRTRGRLAKGSDLHNERTLAQLLTWPVASRRPDISVVLVDADGDIRRKDRLSAAVAAVPGTKLIAVAVQEFESWLIADQRALADVLGVAPAYPGPPESLAPTVAKEQLAGWSASAGKDGAAARRSLAAVCDLDEVARTCSAFAELRRELSIA